MDYEAIEFEILSAVQAIHVNTNDHIARLRWYIGVLWKRSNWRWKRISEMYKNAWHKCTKTHKKLVRKRTNESERQHSFNTSVLVA